MLDRNRSPVCVAYKIAVTRVQKAVFQICVACAHHTPQLDAALLCPELRQGRGQPTTPLFIGVVMPARRHGSAQ